VFGKFKSEMEFVTVKIQLQIHNYFLFQLLLPPIQQTQDIIKNPSLLKKQWNPTYNQLFPPQGP
jgi:hypothetical protein